jgi:hypothetical protein
MLTAYKQDDRTIKIAAGIGIARVKDRMVFAYLYRKYESPETVTLIRKELEVWVDAILAKNR